MKWLKTFLLVAVLALALNVQAADFYNKGTVTMIESETQVTYKWVFEFDDFTTDSTDNIHSPALFIADCNDVDGVWFSKGENAAIDVDFFLHYSADNSNWVVGTTDADINDAAGTTASQDTVGQAENANALYFHQGHLLVIEADGQNTNDLENGYDITVIVSFTKDGTYVMNPEFRVSRYLNSRGTP